MIKLPDTGMLVAPGGTALGFASSVFILISIHLGVSPCAASGVPHLSSRHLPLASLLSSDSQGQALLSILQNAPVGRVEPLGCSQVGLTPCQPALNPRLSKMLPVLCPMAPKPLPIPGFRCPARPPHSSLSTLPFSYDGPHPLTVTTAHSGPFRILLPPRQR